MIPLVMTIFGKLGPSAEWYLQKFADVTVVQVVFLKHRCVPT